MNFLKKLLKGTLLTAMLIGLLGLNMGPTNVEENKANTVAIESQNLWVGNAHAQDEGGEAPATEGGAADADNTVQEESEPPVKEDFLQGMAQLITQVHYVLSPMIFFITNQIGALLSNDYIYGGEMAKMLQAIWVISRNIVNIIFVLILLFIAVQQIFGSQTNAEADLKKKLPLYVLMLVAINFSWLATKVVVDAGNVATNVVFAIPSGVKGTVGDISGPCKIVDGKPNKACMPGTIYFSADASKARDYQMPGANVEIDGSAGEPCPDKDDEVTKTSRIFCWRTLDYARFSKNNAAYYMTYGVAQIQHLVRANTGTATLAGVTKTALGFLFSFLLVIVYGVALLVMFITLIARFVFLWIFIALSPFLVLYWYLTKDFGVPKEEKFSITAFTRWVFVPVKLGAVMSIGFIMVTTGQTMTEFFSASIANKTGDGEQQIMTQVKTLFQGLDNIQEALWLIAVVVIIWEGTFWAVSKLEGIKFITEKLKSAGKSTFEAAGHGIMSAPIIPLGEGKGKSAQDILDMPKSTISDFLPDKAKTTLANSEAIESMKRGSKRDKLTKLITKTGGHKDFYATLKNELDMSKMDVAGLNNTLDSLELDYGAHKDGNFREKIVNLHREEMRRRSKDTGRSEIPETKPAPNSTTDQQTSDEAARKAEEEKKKAAAAAAAKKKAEEEAAKKAAEDAGGDTGGGETGGTTPAAGA